MSSSGAVAGKLDVEDSLLAKQNITDYMSLKDSFFKQKKIYDAKSNKSGHLRGNKTFENTARGPVLAFDGENNYIDVEQRSAINEEWSIAAWVKPRYLEETDSNAVINFRKDDNKCGVCFDIRRERAAVWAENFEIDGSTRWVYGNTELELNEWNLVGVTHGVDGETKIFVNDEIDSIGNKNNTVLRQDLENVRIGSGKGTGRYWDGQIANIIIYNKEITGSEIKELYQRTK